MKALLYTRPRLDGFYHALVREWLGASNYVSMSDHGGLEPLWIMKYFYQASKEGQLRFSRIPLDVDDYHSIILRCRYLRHISWTDAVRHINSMWIAMERILDDIQPDVILGPVMDSYVLDVCDRVARLRNREYSGFLENMINGYCRITSRGELRHHRTPTNEEIDRALGMLHQRTYVPRMQRDGMATIGSINPALILATKYLRDRAKAAYYAVKKISDPDNFYYNTVAAARVGIACTSIAHLKYSQYEAGDWQTRIDNAKANRATIVYLPLQFYPEASIDYWGTSLDFAQFERVTLRMLRAATAEHVVVVKEHPSMTTFRNPAFYQAIQRLQHVVQIPVTVPSNEVLDRADIVVTWTGSVGFEAAIRNLPLVTFGRAYYDTQDSFLSLQSLEELDDLAAICERAQAKHQRSKELELPRVLTSEMLKGLLPGYVFTVDYHEDRRPEERAEIIRLAESLDQFFQILGTGSHPVHPGTLRWNHLREAGSAPGKKAA